MLFIFEYKPKEIGARIHDERRAQKLSQEDLICLLQFKNAGIGRNSLSNIENGVEESIARLSLSTLIALSEIFDCDLGYLLCEYNERRRIAAEICVATGLSEAAGLRLLELKNELPAASIMECIPQKQILSKILSDTDFWRIIKNLQLYSSPSIASIIDLSDRYNSIYQTDSQPSHLNEAYERMPIVNHQRDTISADIAMRFFNVAQRAVDWQTDTSTKPAAKE